MYSSHTQDYREYKNWMSEVKKIDFAEVHDSCTMSPPSDAIISSWCSLNNQLVCLRALGS